MTRFPLSLLNAVFFKAALVQLESELLKDLFAIYRRQWLCHRQMFYHFKCLAEWLSVIDDVSRYDCGTHLILEYSVLVCFVATGTVIKG